MYICILIVELPPGMILRWSFGHNYWVFQFFSIYFGVAEIYCIYIYIYTHNASCYGQTLGRKDDGT